MSLLLLEDLGIRVLTHVTFVARQSGDILDSDVLRDAVMRAEAMEPWRTTGTRGGKPPPSLATYSFSTSRARRECRIDPSVVVETCMFTLEAGESLPVTRLSAYVKGMGSLIERARPSLPSCVDSVGVSFTFITQYSEIVIDGRA